MTITENYPLKVISPNTSKIVHRVRLFKELDDIRKNAKIIWISAPGGSGKTTLVSSYLEKNKLAHCWYQIDEEDRNLTTFFHYLGLAGKRAAPRRKKSTLKLTPDHQQQISVFTRLFFKDISSRLKNVGLIVLDNFHLLPENDPIPRLLPVIADSLVPGVSLVIISRHIPPTSMVSLIVKRELMVIDTNSIRFSEKEWLAAADLFKTKHSKQQQLSLHNKLDGWIAGLILSSESPNALGNTNTSGLGFEMLDTYIAEQFFNSLDLKTSQLLMKVCYMPHITVKSAISVSENTQAKKILASLAQKNLFVMQQGNNTYILHPLIREYLKQYSTEKLTCFEIHTLRLATANALLEEHEYESAADILLDLKLWDKLKSVILNYASELHESGRIELLARYIDVLTDEFIVNEPWIFFWKGKISIYTDVMMALDYYDKAFVEFMNSSDITGIYMSWYSATSVICHTLIGGNRLITWVKRYDKLSELYPDPPKEIEKGFIDAILLHSYYCSGLEPKTRKSLQIHLANEIDKTNNPALRIHMISNYVHVAVLSGITDSDITIIENLKSHLEKIENEPMSYLGALTFSSLAAWAYNDYEKVLKLEMRALSVAKENGISVFDCHIYTKIVIAALGLYKFDLAKKYINIMKKNIDNKDKSYQSLYFLSMIAAGTYMDETSELNKSAKHYFSILKETHFPPLIIHTKLFYAYYLCVHEKTTMAMSLHDNLLMQVKEMDLPAQLCRFYMIYAKIFLIKGEEDRCDNYLNVCFAIASRHDFITYANWHPDLMAWACQRVLKNGIETNYINRFVKTHLKNLPSPDAGCTIDQWPWSFQIYTFGNFRLEMTNQSTHQKKGTDKSLSILKLLVKSPEKQVSTKMIKEILYFKINHEKTSQLLDTQIHRLKKYLGNDDAVYRKGDNILLNLKHFWIDEREFESLYKQEISQKNAQEVAKKVQVLYRGEFMPDDESLEIMARRERYRSMYLSILFKCIHYMNNTPDMAIDICLTALTLEPLSEPLYRKLISSYIIDNNRDMAAVTLEQCRALVKRHLDSDLTSETLEILNIH